MIFRKANQNVVSLSEAEYQELEKARRNNAYLAKLDRANEQIAVGKTITKTMEELEVMAK